MKQKQKQVCVDSEQEWEDNKGATKFDDDEFNGDTYELELNSVDSEQEWEEDIDCTEEYYTPNDLDTDYDNELWLDELMED